jgi:alanine racemase
MFNIHQELLTRPTFLEIDLDALRYNFHQVKKKISDKKLLCIVKGNAYGHGSEKMGLLFQELGADYLGVAIPEEGVELRRAGIHIPILVLSAIADKQISVCLDYDLTITAPSDERLLLIEKTAQEKGIRAKVHIKIDTGMGRIGVNWERALKLIEPIKNTRHIDFEGIYSHFARSDEYSDFTQIQIDRFSHVIHQFADHGITFAIKHIANSGGILFHTESHYDMVRAGMILYGLFEGRDHREIINLEPAMSWKTEVTYFKYVPEGTGIGYGHVYVAPHDTRIVTLPVGYADGYQRAMGPHGRVIINDTLYPIAGRICMDQMMVDIGSRGEAYKRDEVLLVGTSPTHSITFFDIAEWSHTSIYELLSQISYRVPRVYVDTKK